MHVYIYSYVYRYAIPHRREQECHIACRTGSNRERLLVHYPERVPARAKEHKRICPQREQMNS